MAPEKQKAIASKGGKTAHAKGRGHEWTKAEATAAGLQFDPSHPYGEGNYCINTALQFYDAALTPLGNNLRLSPHTWDPQLSAPHTGCICGSTTFIGDYFGVDASGTTTYTTSVSTYDDGTNPSNYQQQIVTTTPTP